MRTRVPGTEEARKCFLGFPGIVSDTIRDIKTDKTLQGFTVQWRWHTHVQVTDERQTMYKWRVRGKYSRKRLIHLWGVAGSSHPVTHPVPKFPLQYSCQVINLWLNLPADRICIMCSILPRYSIVCPWTALTLKSPFLFGTEICLPVVPTSGTGWSGTSVGKQFGLEERMWDLELEGLRADPSSDTRQWWTVFFTGKTGC